MTIRSRQASCLSVEWPDKESSSLRAFFAALALLTCLGLVACEGSDAPVEQVSAEHLAELAVLSAGYTGQPAESLVDDAEALALGSRLFAAHCAGCHGSDGSGARGIPDLTRGRFDYGSSLDAIRLTIRSGRRSEMPGFGAQYNEFGVGQLVRHVAALPDIDASSQGAGEGHELFQATCAECHGENGRGNTELGAPDLADDYWQYSDSMTNIRSIITNGIAAECPPHADVLTVAEIELLAASVFRVLRD